MQTLKIAGRLFAIGAAVLVLAACTRSLPATYQQGVDVSDTRIPKNLSVAVAKLEDKRAWASTGDDKAHSFIASQGVWKFGLTYGGKEFAPVVDVIQDILVQEFTAAGIRTQKLSTVLSGDRQALAALRGKADYVLGGKVVAFEFANDAGLVTVTSRRTVSLSLTLARIDGRRLFTDRTFDENNSENEGMGVLHSTNIDKLMNGVLKSTIKKVIKGVASEATIAQVDVRVLDGDSVVAYRLHTDGEFYRQGVQQVAAAR